MWAFYTFYNYFFIYLPLSSVCCSFDSCTELAGLHLVTQTPGQSKRP